MKLWNRLLNFRRNFARNLGLNEDRKWQIYQEISESVSLSSSSYWLQVLFAAGIATLGLVLNSPAVIIGAMLISPLMGSILASGLGLAVGDLVLVARATVNLILSCALAIALALLLVFCLPFKEITSEILARTQPNLLDLLVALFSGAVGSVAICQVSKGVATSLPGVAIAVALMPPLCVVGYGLGIQLSVANSNGLQIALGGGLLFFTNLVAIIFTAMVVFFLVHLDTSGVRLKVKQWQSFEPESQKFQEILNNLPSGKYFHKIGSLPARFTLILLAIALISLPLNQSLMRLRQEISRKQQENQLRSLITTTWQENLGGLNNGKNRSYINRLTVNENKGQLQVELQVVTNQFYSQAEQQKFIEQLAQALRRSPDRIQMNLIEIPTGKFVEPVAMPSGVPVTIADLQTQLQQQINNLLKTLPLPKPAQLLTTHTTLTPDQPLALEIIYLSDRPIQSDAQLLITEQIRQQLQIPTAEIRYQFLALAIGTLTFTPDQNALTPAQKELLEKTLRLLRQYPTLTLKLHYPTSPPSPDFKPAQAVQDYLLQQGINRDRWQEIPLLSSDNTIKLSWQ